MRTLPLCLALASPLTLNLLGDRGSHKADKVKAIAEMRAAQWVGEGQDRKWVGDKSEGAFLEPFTANGLTPVVLNSRAGDLVLFDTGM